MIGLARRERRPVWCGVVLLSILAALFLVAYNLNDFLSSFTVTTLESATQDLENIYFPSVTICNRNQIRSATYEEIKSYLCIFIALIHDNRKGHSLNAHSKEFVLD